MQIIKKQFNNQEITFDLNGQGMVNATEMANANGKLIADFFRLESTNEYLKALSSDMGIPISQLYVQNKGNFADGRSQGTWVHRKLAIRIAQWCSPKFAVQVDSWIEELFLKGKVELKPKTIEEMTLLVIQDLQSKVLQQQKQLEEQKPLVAYAEAMGGEESINKIDAFIKAYSSNTGYEIGKNKLFQVLRSRLVFTQSNLPYQSYVHDGYFVVNKQYLPDLDKFSFRTDITPKGEKWLTNWLNKTLPKYNWKKRG